MKFNSNKERGNSGLGVAIGYFTTQGYTVSVPLNDTQDYDLIIEKNNKFNSVQVKATGFKTRCGIYQVALKSCGGTKGKIYKTIKDTTVDYLFVLVENLDMYLIPIPDIKNTSTLNLGIHSQKYKVYYK